MKKLTAALLICLLLCSCGDKGTLSSTQVMMSTVVSVTLYDGNEEILNRAVELCREYEKLFSLTIEGSDTLKINRSGNNPVEVSDATAELIRLSLRISEASGGAFDITVLPLTRLWNIAESDTVPADEDIAAALEAVDWRSISCDGSTVLSGGAEIDLGGIAKGYIADKVCEYLRSAGVKRAIVNLGGNVAIIGDKNGRPYSVGIQKPFALHGETAAELFLSDKTAVTSGVYERYFTSNGKIYHHIIDPATGYPAESGVASVTVIADSSALADGLSTACLILGVEKGTALAESFGAEVVFIGSDGAISGSKGLEISSDSPPRITLKQ